jgi:hypothetical protein
MPILTLNFEGNRIGDYPVDDGTSLTIGRRDSNDIVIDNLGVSANHAKIESVDKKFLLTDLQSRNGTFVNDRLIASHWLEDGDVISIGKHTLCFSAARKETRAGGSSSDSMIQGTMLLDTEKFQALLAKNFEKTGPGVIERETIGAISFLAGGQGEIKLSRKLTKIGKAPSADIVVRGLFVGKVAAAISNKPNGYYLGYVGGWAKPKVNGKTVKNSVKIEEFDIIELGSAKMQFIHKFVYKK